MSESGGDELSFVGASYEELPDISLSDLMHNRKWLGRTLQPEPPRGRNSRHRAALRPLMPLRAPPLNRWMPHYRARALPSISEEQKGHQTLSPEVTLKYSCFKNLGNLYMKSKKFDEASKYYLKAVAIDSTEVGVCYRLGLAAIQLGNYDLALEAFLEGLKTSPKHLICLDQLLSVYFILGFHQEVLATSIAILSLYPNHAKARTFTKYVLTHLPHHGETVRHLCNNSEVLFETDVEYDKEAGEKYLAKCLSLRVPVKEYISPAERAKRQGPITQPLVTPLNALSWSALGASVLDTLVHLDTQPPSLFSARVLMEESLTAYQAKLADETKKIDCQEKISEQEDAVKMASATRGRRTTIETGESQSTFRMDMTENEGKEISEEPASSQETDDVKNDKLPGSSEEPTALSLNKISSPNRVESCLSNGKRIQVDLTSCHNEQNLPLADKEPKLEASSASVSQSSDSTKCFSKRKLSNSEDEEREVKKVKGNGDSQESLPESSDEETMPMYPSCSDDPEDKLSELSRRKNNTQPPRRPTESSECPDTEQELEDMEETFAEDEGADTEEDTLAENEDEFDIALLNRQIHSAVEGNEGEWTDYGDPGLLPENHIADSLMQSLVPDDDDAQEGSSMPEADDGSFEFEDLPDNPTEKDQDVAITEEQEDVQNTLESDEGKNSEGPSEENIRVTKPECCFQEKTAHHHSAMNDGLPSPANGEVLVEHNECAGENSPSKGKESGFNTNGSRLEERNNHEPSSSLKCEKQIPAEDGTVLVEKCKDENSKKNKKEICEEVMKKIDCLEKEIENTEHKAVAEGSEAKNVVKSFSVDSCKENLDDHQESEEKPISDNKEDKVNISEEVEKKKQESDSTNCETADDKSTNCETADDKSTNCETADDKSTNCETADDKSEVATEDDPTENDKTDTGDDKNSATDLEEDCPTRTLHRGRTRGRRSRRNTKSSAGNCSPRTTSGMEGPRGRRGLRGLERELQQLDYWGRRSDGNATKRRRRTATDGITVTHLLQSFVPASLLRPNTTVNVTYNNIVTSNEDGSTATAKPALTSPDGKQLPSATTETSAHISEEKDQVREFLLASNSNHGILDVVGKLLVTMVEQQLNQTSKPWPTQDVSLFVSLYPYYRASILLDSPLDYCERAAKELRTHCLISLSYWELCLSVAVTKKTKLPTEHRGDDLLQLSLLLGRFDVHSPLQCYKQRFSWLMAQVSLQDNLHDTAVLHLTQVVEECSELGVAELLVSRCEGDSHRVTLTRAKSLLKSLQRRQLVLQVEEEYREGNYPLVVEVVSGELLEDNAGFEFSDDEQRTSHCLMLVKSIKALGNDKDLFELGSQVLLAVMKSFQGSFDDIDEDISSAGQRTKDAELVILLLESLFEVLEKDNKIVESISCFALVRLVEGLILVLVQQLELQQDLLASSVTPWVLLHKVLKQQELASSASKPLPSTQLLITAHEELAKQDRCCCEDGKLLKYSLLVVLDELLEPSLPPTSQANLMQARDQFIHCLYQLPARKNKRGIRYHNSTGVALTVSDAVALYPHYVPESLPEFESASPPSIPEDTTAIFKSILEILPPEYSLEDKLKEIDCLLNRTALKLSEADDQHLFVKNFPDIHYLISDSFFKNKEWESAVFYYKHDLAVFPKRLDSWAGLALAKKTILETKLNSCDVISDQESFLKDVTAAVVCFEQALLLDDENSNLLVEFGGLVYMTHSHASRLLKQELNPDLSIEMYQLLEDTKVKMLGIAENCFKSALQLSLAKDEWDDERWLYYYMLGKIAEKKAAPPKDVIEAYLSAANDLQTNCASYPSKINYNNPQKYSIEALEMYYRVHSYIIKCIELKEGSKHVCNDTIHYFLSVTSNLLQSPFYTMKEFKNKESSENNRKWIENLVLDIVNKAVLKSNVKRNFDSSVEEIPLSQIPKRKTDCDDDDILVLEETQEQKDKKVIVFRCLEAFRLCLSRFPHHYKSLFRLAHYYFNAKSSKDNSKTRDFLLGCPEAPDGGPQLGLFTERKISYPQPKNCNLFHGIWRIPNDEIDRPGSFASHMYRCVSLSLDVLPAVKDFLMVLDIALALKSTPDKDKKYLRENERHLLCEHAVQVGLQALKDKHRLLFKTNNIPRHRRLIFVLDVYRCLKNLSRHLNGSESVLSSILCQSYCSLQGLPNAENPSQLKDAEQFCAQHNSLLGKPHSRGRPAKKLQALQLQKAEGISNHSSLQSSATESNNTSGRNNNSNNCSGRSLATPQPRSLATPVPRATATLQVNKTPSPCSSDDDTVRKAYTVYEKLFQCQNYVRNNKNIDQKTLSCYRVQMDIHQKELLQYLKIPAVSQYFQKVLQQIDKISTKLPAPNVPAGKSSSSYPSAATFPKINKPKARPTNSAPSNPTVSAPSSSQTQKPSSNSTEMSLSSYKKSHLAPKMDKSAKSYDSKNFPALPEGLSVTISTVKKNPRPNLSFQASESHTTKTHKPTIPSTIHLSTKELSEFVFPSNPQATKSFGASRKLEFGPSTFPSGASPLPAPSSGVTITQKKVLPESAGRKLQSIRPKDDGNAGELPIAKKQKLAPPSVSQQSSKPILKDPLARDPASSTGDDDIITLD